MDELDKYVKAGRIVARVLSKVEKMVEDGMLVLELCEEIEEEIWKLGGKPAFPCNVSQGYVAAHYTPAHDDKTRINGSNVVKIDVGAHVDGYIADAAISITWDPSNEKLLDVAKGALDVALSSIKPGGELASVGRIVEQYVKQFGFKPIDNLAGHQLDRYNLHSGVSIPNVALSGVKGVFKLGGAYAIEPFIVPVNGAGHVVEGSSSNIFRLVSRRVFKDEFLTRVVNYVWENYRTLPFASRWLTREFGPKALGALEELKKKRVVFEYPMLIERNRVQVAQFEHTVVITRDGVVVTTRGV